MPRLLLVARFRHSRFLSLILCCDAEPNYGLSTKPSNVSHFPCIIQTQDNYVGFLPVRVFIQDFEIMQRLRAILLANDFSPARLRQYFTATTSEAHQLHGYSVMNNNINQCKKRKHNQPNAIYCVK